MADNSTSDGGIKREQAPESSASLDGDVNKGEAEPPPGSTLDGEMKIDHAQETPGNLDGAHSAVGERGKIPEENGNEPVSDGKKERKQGKNVVAYYKLFSFADSFDYFLMFCGVISAVGNGFCLPLMSLLFGELIDATGKPASTTDMVHGVFKVSENTETIECYFSIGKLFLYLLTLKLLLKL